MTTQQKSRIAYLRSIGTSYGDIATELELSINTIKSHCRRHTATQAENICAQCHKRLIQKSGIRRKRFCTDVCRMIWWKENPAAVNRRAVYRFTCATCNIPFESYGNANRKYCSRACFGLSRRKSHE